MARKMKYVAIALVTITIIFIYLYQMVIVKYALNYFDKIFILVKMINAKN